MKGGADSVDKSPEKEEIDFKKEVQDEDLAYSVICRCYCFGDGTGQKMI